MQDDGFAAGEFEHSLETIARLWAIPACHDAAWPLDPIPATIRSSSGGGGSSGT